MEQRRMTDAFFIDAINKLDQIPLLVKDIDYMKGRQDEIYDSLHVGDVNHPPIIDQVRKIADKVETLEKKAEKRWERIGIFTGLLGVAYLLAKDFFVKLLHL